MYNIKAIIPGEIAANTTQNKNLKSNKSNRKLPSSKKEVGGPKGPEPTRYGDWEKKGICYDF